MSEQARGVRRFVERTAPPRPGAGGGYVVAAGKGGVGTSTVALLLAFAARRYGPVVLVDARGGFGGPAALLGLDEDVEGDEVFRTSLGPDLVLVHSGPGALPEGAQRRMALRRAAREERGATVIVDAGARPATAIGALNDYGTRLVTVMAADGTSPAAAYGLAKLAWHVRPETRVAGVANRVSETDGGLVREAARTAVRRFADRHLEWLGEFPAAPSLVAPESPPWATLDQTEPDLMSAAAAAATRLLRKTTMHVNPTLHLLK